MRPEHKPIAARFSRASDSYADSAEIQRGVVDDLMGWLPDSGPVRILEIGCGTGLLTERLLERYPQAEIDAVDVAAGMIEHCRVRFEKFVQVHWHCADILDFESADKYDLIVSSSALHWVQDLPLLFTRLRGLLAENGKLFFSAMLKNTFCELRESKKIADLKNGKSAQLPSAEYILSALETGGFSVLKQAVFCRQSRHASAMEFFKSISYQGVTAGSVSRLDAPLSPAELRRLASVYGREFGDASGCVPATFEIGVFVCHTVV
jgi:malonyl-ACP O-methyltransferase BioC